MEKGNRSYAIALFALKVPPGCHAQAHPGGVTFSACVTGHAHHRVEVFLRAGYAYAGSPQEPEASYLDFLRGHLPARNGWACHSVSVEEWSELNELTDELRQMISQLERGVPLGSENRDDGTESSEELPLM